MTVLTGAEQFDQQCITQARELAAVKNTDDIVALYDSWYGAESFQAGNARRGAYPVGFSRAQATLSDLLAIIERQRELIARQGAELEQLQVRA